MREQLQVNAKDLIETVGRDNFYRTIAPVNYFADIILTVSSFMFSWIRFSFLFLDRGQQLWNDSDPQGWYQCGWTAN